MRDAGSKRLTSNELKLNKFKLNQWTKIILAFQWDTVLYIFFLQVCAQTTFFFLTFEGVAKKEERNRRRRIKKGGGAEKYIDK